jgi:hypothetical protein
MERDAYGYPIDRAERCWIGRAFEGSIPTELQEGPQVVFPPPPVLQPGGGFVWMRWIRQHWYLCRIFRPTYSRERSVPLWIFVRIGMDELRGATGTLQAAVRSLVSGEGLAEIDRRGPTAWLIGKPPEPLSTVEPVDILRSANQVHQWLSGHSGTSGVNLGLTDDRAFMGLQAVLSATTGGGEPAWKELSLRLPAEEADPPMAGPVFGVKPTDSAESDMPSFSVRGVRDEDWACVAGWRELVDRGIRRHGARSVRSLLQDEDPPLEMLPACEVRTEEQERYAESVLGSPRRDQVIREVALLARQGNPLGIALTARFLAVEAERHGLDPRTVDRLLDTIIPQAG